MDRDRTDPYGFGRRDERPRGEGGDGGRVGDGGVELTSSQVDEAAEIGDGLKEFYPKFKVIKSWPCRPALPSPAHVWPAHTGRASPLKPTASDLRR